MTSHPYFWIYMLECENGAYYVGYTTNLTRRLTAAKAPRRCVGFAFMPRPIVRVSTKLSNMTRASWPAGKSVARSKEKLLAGDRWQLSIWDPSRRHRSRYSV